MQSFAYFIQLPENELNLFLLIMIKYDKEMIIRLSLSWKFHYDEVFISKYLKINLNKLKERQE